jgi:hypothetical protein
MVELGPLRTITVGTNSTWTFEPALTWINTDLRRYRAGTGGMGRPNAHYRIVRLSEPRDIDLVGRRRGIRSDITRQRPTS